MSTTTEEKVGDVIYGTHLVTAFYEDGHDQDGNSVLIPEAPLKGGRSWTPERAPRSKKYGIVVGWKVERSESGRRRRVRVELDTSAHDETRATSRFEVMRVKQMTHGDDALDVFLLESPLDKLRRFLGRSGEPEKYGIEVLVRRLDGNGEEILYTRDCGYVTDVDESATLT